MKQYVAYGIQSKTVIAKGNEAEVHQYLNLTSPSYKAIEVRKDGRADRERLIDPIYPESIRIEKADELYAGMD